MRNLLWLDLETTGLVPEVEDILMVAAARANEDGEIIESREWVVQTAIQEVDLDPVVLKMHTENGLLARVRSDEALDSCVVETELKAFIGFDKPILAGNSIHFDRSFLWCHMREVVEERLHYRMLDVSALKVAAQVWGLPEYSKKSKHLALDDIKASIAEFMHWKRAFGLGETK